MYEGEDPLEQMLQGNDSGEGANMQESVPMDGQNPTAEAQQEGSAHMSDQIADGFVMLDNAEVNQVISDEAADIGEADGADQDFDGSKPEFGALASKILSTGIAGINRAPAQNQTLIPQNYDTHV